MEQAAAEYNVDIRFITLYEKGDSAQQMEFLRREIDDGTGAVILEPADPAECRRLLDSFTPGSPVIVTGSLIHSDPAAACVSVDASLGRRYPGTARPAVSLRFLRKIWTTEASGSCMTAFCPLLTDKTAKSACMRRQRENTWRRR